MKCVFCKLETSTRRHHIVPRSVGGKETVDACKTCEEWIHRQFSHKELRDIYNTVESIQENEKFKKFLEWRVKQPPETTFKSKRGKNRDKHKYH